VSAVGKNLQAFKIAVNAHDRENPTHSLAYGIVLSHYDMERLGFDEGEELWPGCHIYGDDRPAGGFHVLCDTEEPRVERAQVTDAISREREVVLS